MSLLRNIYSTTAVVLCATDDDLHELHAVTSMLGANNRVFLHLSKRIVDAAFRADPAVHIYLQCLHEAHAATLGVALRWNHLGIWNPAAGTHYVFPAHRKVACRTPAEIAAAFAKL